MDLLRRAFRIACVLLIFGWAATAQAQSAAYPVIPGLGDGGQVQIGTGLPLPIQFPGAPPVGPTFPALQVPVVPGAKVTMPTGSMPATPKPMKIPPMILSAPTPAGTMTAVGQFLANPALWQVATALSFGWPNASATLCAGCRTTAPTTSPSVFAGAGGGTVTYTAGAAQFGGPAQFRLKNGQGAGGGLFPGRPVTLWVNIQGKTPGSPTPPPLLAGIVPANPAGGPLGTGTIAAAMVGGPAGTGTATPGTPFHATAVRAVWVNGLGSILASGPAGTGLFNNMATSSWGFPWTTGMIVVAAPAVPPETFTLTGSDGRDAFGMGSISLVSGGLSKRTMSGFNANRGWVRLTLPEPAAVLGAVGAFAMLGLCHAGLARRRS